MEKLKGVERFGFSQEEAERLKAEMRPLIDRMPAVRSLHKVEGKTWERNDFGAHMLDWEAELLRQVFEHFKGVNPDVCTLVAYLVRISNYHEGIDYLFPRSEHIARRDDAAA